MHKFIVRIRALQQNRRIVSQCKRFCVVSSQPDDFTDCSGYPIRLSSAESLELYNNVIHNFLTHQNNPAKELRKIRETHKNVAMVNSLLVFQMIRQPLPSNRKERKEIEDLLLNLENQCLEGKLSDREEYYAAGAASFAEGNYLKAAALMESLFIGRKSDIMALKLAQDSYMLAGDSVNALGCVARWMHLFDSDHKHYGSLLGIFAMGLAECGKFSEAEEIGNKAVNRTKGQDVWALHALLNTYLSLGRSSEVNTTLHDHLSKHFSNSVGLSILMFNKGCGLIQRGNYTGALKVHDSMVFDMAGVPDKEGQIAGSIANATLLLWLTDINSPSAMVDERWDYKDSTAGMWTDGLDAEDDGVLKCMSPMNELCRAIAIGAGERCATGALPRNALTYVADNDEEEDDDEEMRAERKKGKDVKRGVTEEQLLADVEGKISLVESGAKTLFLWFRGVIDPSYVKPVEEVPISLQTPEEIAEKASALSEKLEASATQHQVSLLALRQLLQGGRKEYPPLLEICPTLLNTRPNRGAMRRIPEAPDALKISDRKWATQSVSEPLSEAMLSFSRHEYNEASERIAEVSQMQVLNRLGGTIVQRDVVNQTMIESLMRCGKLAEAETFLTERTALVPNDAQSWRRLASVYGRTGARGQADRAHYTAWQLGIGQGGFGGPK